MSQENVEIVRRAIQAFNRGDLVGALRDVAPDAVFDWSHSRGPNPGVHVGHDAIQRFLTRMTEPFEALAFVPDELLPYGDRVIVALTGRMTGRGGIEVEVRTTTVTDLRDGLLVRWTMYQDKADALKAVGLEK